MLQATVGATRAGSECATMYPASPSPISVYPAANPAGADSLASGPARSRGRARTRASVDTVMTSPALAGLPPSAVSDSGSETSIVI
jgi:hypothetical protein